MQIRRGAACAPTLSVIQAHGVVRRAGTHNKAVIDAGTEAEYKSAEWLDARFGGRAHWLRAPPGLCVNWIRAWKDTTLLVRSPACAG